MIQVYLAGFFFHCQCVTVIVQISFEHLILLKHRLVGTLKHPKFKLCSMSPEFVAFDAMNTKMLQTSFFFLTFVGMLVPS